MTDEARVREALSRIVDPAKGVDIVTADLVRSLSVAEGRVSFVIEVDPARGGAMEPLRQAAEAAVKALDGVSEVSAVMTAHSAAGQAPKAPAAKGPVPDLGLKDFTPKPKAPEGPAKLPGVARVIAIASGKGGVGKSTVSANLAVALAARGLRVGLLDADVYGPSQPRMLGVSGRPSAAGNTILPLRNHGVTVMSLGLILRRPRKRSEIRNPGVRASRTSPTAVTVKSAGNIQRGGKATATTSGATPKNSTNSVQSRPGPMGFTPVSLIRPTFPTTPLAPLPAIPITHANLRVRPGGSRCRKEPTFSRS